MRTTRQLQDQTGVSGGGYRDLHTASCFNLFPSVVRIVVSFATKFRYCVARVSFSSRVRSSSLCSLVIGSRSSSSSTTSELVPLGTVFVFMGGVLLRSLSNEVRSSEGIGLFSEFSAEDEGSEAPFVLAIIACGMKETVAPRRGGDAHWIILCSPLRYRAKLVTERSFMRAGHRSALPFLPPCRRQGGCLNPSPIPQQNTYNHRLHRAR